MVNGLWFILGIIEVYLQIWYRYLTIGIRALSLADIVGKYFLFLQIFFFGEEKRGPRHSRNFWYISVKNLQKKGCISEFLSEKHPS
jgi:hypothetical protein